ncbi:MFS transporter [Novosphingobium endophyticum]|nr:MFS transporter [Novosphingobium endophyticum]
MKDRHPPLPHGEWRNGWPVVATSVLGVALSVVHFYSLGVFLEPIQREFGWTRAQITGGFAIYSILTTVGSVVVGTFVDRVGPRRVALVGAILYSAGLASLATADGNIWGWWMRWAFLAAGGSCLTATVWSTAIGAAFSRHRGLAIAIALSGTAIASGVYPLTAGLMIEAFGWRMAYVGLASFGLLIVLPVLFLFFRIHRADVAGDPTETIVPLSGVSFPEGVRSANYRRLLIATFLFTLAITALHIHFVPILMGSGWTTQEAAGMAIMIGISMVVGRVSAGVLIDRFNPLMIAIGAFMLPIFASGTLILLPTYPALAIVVAILLGLSSGSEVDVVGYLATRFFGLKSFGRLFGIITGGWALASSIGPVAGSFSYDAFGSYEVMVWSTLAMFVLALIPILRLRRLPALDYYRATSSTSDTNRA